MPESAAKATDAAARKAEELGVDLSAVEPTGKDGQVTVQDVEKAVEEEPAEVIQEIDLRDYEFVAVTINPRLEASIFGASDGETYRNGQVVSRSIYEDVLSKEKHDGFRVFYKDEV